MGLLGSMFGSTFGLLFLVMNLCMANFREMILKYLLGSMKTICFPQLKRIWHTFLEL